MFSVNKNLIKYTNEFSCCFYAHQFPLKPNEGEQGRFNIWLGLGYTP